MTGSAPEQPADDRPEAPVDPDFTPAPDWMAELGLSATYDPPPPAAPA